MRITHHAPVIGALIFSLLTAGSLAVGGETRDDITATPPTTAPEPDEATEGDKEAPRKTEGLKPPGRDKLNPEESQLALLNPCRGTPRPRWCEE